MCCIMRFFPVCLISQFLPALSHEMFAQSSLLDFIKIDQRIDTFFASQLHPQTQQACMKKQLPFTIPNIRFLSGMPSIFLINYPTDWMASLEIFRLSCCSSRRRKWRCLHVHKKANERIELIIILTIIKVQAQRATIILISFLHEIHLNSVKIETKISIFLLIGRIAMKDRSTELFEELLKRNQRNSQVIHSFLRTADRRQRYIRKINHPIVQGQSKILLSPPLLHVNKHSSGVLVAESKTTQKLNLDESKENQLRQSHSYFDNRQRKFEVKSLLKFVREGRETKLKQYNIHTKKHDSLQGKLISRVPLHLKDITFFGESKHKLELRRNGQMKCNLNILPLLKTENHNTSLHNSIPIIA